MFEITEFQSQKPIIKVIGIGNHGTIAIEYMMAMGMQGVEFIAIENSELISTYSPSRIQTPTGNMNLEGLPVQYEHHQYPVGTLSMQDSVKSFFEKSDVAFIIAEMDGNTGTAISTIVAQIAHDMKVLTIAVVSVPPAHEGEQILQASEAIKPLHEIIDSIIIVPDKNTMETFTTNDFICCAIGSLTDAINQDALINVELCDIRTLFSKTGITVMGSATASGLNRSRIAVEQAVSTLIKANKGVIKAQCILGTITCDSSFTMQEYKAVMQYLRKINEEATVILSTHIIDSNSDGLHVTIFAMCI